MHGRRRSQPGSLYPDGAAATALAGPAASGLQGRGGGREGPGDEEGDDKDGHTCAHTQAGHPTSSPPQATVIAPRGLATQVVCLGDSGVRLPMGLPCSLPVQACTPPPAPPAGAAAGAATRCVLTVGPVLAPPCSSPSSSRGWLPTCGHAPRTRALQQATLRGSSWGRCDLRNKSSCGKLAVGAVSWGVAGVAGS